MIFFRWMVRIALCGWMTVHAAHPTSSTLTEKKTKTPFATTTTSSFLRGGAPVLSKTKKINNVGPRFNNNNKNNNKIKTRLPVGTAPVSSQIFNLIKTIVGAGVLGLPAGMVASFAVAHHDSLSATLVPSMICLLAIGALAAYAFCLIGTLCEQTQSTTYREVWKNTVGPQTAWIPAVACTAVTVCSCIAYSMILGTMVPELLQSILNGFNFMGHKNGVLTALTVFLLLPLCLLRNLSSLAPFSLLGIGGMVYTGLAMQVQHWKGSYPPAMYTSVKSTSASPAILLSMLSTAYMAHYNAPKIYWELQDDKKRDFNKVVGASFAGSMGLMTLIAGTGLATFGVHSASVILSNYNDPWMRVAKWAVALSLICSYPLAFTGVRDGILEYVKPAQRDASFVPVTVSALAIITGIAMTLTNLQTLLAVGGATWGNAVIYLFPAMMFISNENKKAPKDRKSVIGVYAMALTGLALGVVGTSQAIA
ncbi:hypothetical protein FisN_18Lh234 [Fistulifera solaris]|uniref:Amino acid transporter transmembrane domain-containing protein n=1 Tax=Fistulifera solaris TaxID=1519565 RepID=A0A1Z5JV05_FISSO|nr:hypothetical protein FisN_18Lh234 [Fistulifera solaris]|eukprot:GAX17581.1 hypothetical protein FisN_18Lh234 [Fistulifera solaris]